MLNSNIEVETAVSMPDHLLRACLNIPLQLTKQTGTIFF